jgi:mannose-6-phosphate isomerase-like protein (cupin superfamily)
MASYTTVNLLEVENVIGDRAPGIDGRFTRKQLDSRDLGVSRFTYAPNTRSPMAHSHREQEEAYVVVAGSGRVMLDDEIIDLHLWDVLRVAPEVVRAFEGGPDGLDLIAVRARRRATGSQPPPAGRTPSRRGASARRTPEWPRTGVIYFCVSSRRESSLENADGPSA